MSRATPRRWMSSSSWESDTRSSGMVVILFTRRKVTSRAPSPWRSSGVRCTSSTESGSSSCSLSAVGTVGWPGSSAQGRSRTGWRRMPVIAAGSGRSVLGGSQHHRGCGGSPGRRARRPSGLAARIWRRHRGCDGDEGPHPALTHEHREPTVVRALRRAGLPGRGRDDEREPAGGRPLQDGDRAACRSIDTPNASTGSSGETTSSSASRSSARRGQV